MPAKKSRTPSRSTEPQKQPPSPEQMHNDFVRKWPDMFLSLKQATKEMFSNLFSPRTSRVSVTLRGLQTYPPHWPVTSVLLHELFPVMEGARAVDDQLVRMASAQSDVENFASYFKCFETKHHGRMTVMVVTAARNNVTDMSFDVIADEEDGGYRMELDSGIPINGRVEPGEEYRSLALVGVIPFQSDCAGCGKAQGDDRFCRCARCWERLRIPVWYCCRACQVAHYPQHHKRVCGKVI